MQQDVAVQNHSMSAHSGGTLRSRAGEGMDARSGRLETLFVQSAELTKFAVGLDGRLNILASRVIGRGPAQNIEATGEGPAVVVSQLDALGNEIARAAAALDRASAELKRLEEL